MIGWKGIKMKIETYNNIGISLVAFLSIVKEVEDISFSKALLIQPLLLHNRFTKYMQDGRTKVKGIEDLILSKVEYFLDFNDRFISLLPLSLNTILLAEKLGFIEISNHKISTINRQLDTFDFNDKHLGDRAKNIIKASVNVAKILQEESSNELYFKLRIEL